MSSAKPPAPPNEKPDRRDPPLRRWLNVACRSLHVVGIILLGAALLAGTATTSGALLTAASGLGMLALDTWRKPAHLAEVSGLGVLAKLPFVALAAFIPSASLALFWSIVIVSMVLSHAPAAFRHRRLFERR
ncbi:hypothetical protein [uncultured Propionivibrio sp.]|uniref:hypothetical protein n=1 Tax=uncultured Propionivibrio sp. TaxID=426737 RepID=UPI0029BFE30F|nr:hypothetical protein [uncultured Propionivibrio sp.]